MELGLPTGVSGGVIRFGSKISERTTHRWRNVVFVFLFMGSCPTAVEKSFRVQGYRVLGSGF